MATLAGLVHGMPSQFILLTTLSAATQRIPAREVLREAAFTATVGHQIDEAALRSFLVRMGFTQAPTVIEPGDFAVRGGIIDIYPPGQVGPVRLDLFGDVLDGARRFDPVSQRTVENAFGYRTGAGFRGHHGRGRDHPVPAELPDRVRRGGHRRSACMRPSARGASIRVSSTGCRSFTSVWKRCSTICRMPRSASTTRSRRHGWRGGTASRINTRPGALRWARRTGWIRSTNPRRRGCLYLDDAAWDGGGGRASGVAVSVPCRKPWART